jgi:diamine N-acetyltransferase
MKDDPHTKIKLRALEPADIELLLKWENDREIWHLSNTLAPFSRYILEQYIENSAHDIYTTKQLRLMADVYEGDSLLKTVGCVDLFDFEPFHLRAGVGILIADQNDRQKGFGKALLSELIHYAFAYLHLHQLYCNIGADNKVSLSLFESCGFRQIGLKKDWVKSPEGFSDEYLLQLIGE